MKTKLYAKKTLSVFLAVLMLMSAWVLSPGEHNHASASGTDNAAAVSNANSNKINELNSLGLNTNVTTVRGSFVNDGDNVTDDNYNAVYHNVLWTDGTVQNDDGCAVTDKIQYGKSWTGANGVTAHWYHPQATLMYDGDTSNVPRLGIMLNSIMYFDGAWSRESYNINSWVESGGNGFTINQNWHGSDSRPNFQWTWHSTPEVMGYTKTTKVIEDYQSGNGDNHFYANLLKFTDTMDDNEFYRTVTPTFGFFGGNINNSNTGYATTTKSISILNYVPLKKALEDAITTVNNIRNTPAKYNVDSVKELVEATKDLINAKPNNYAQNLAGYETAAKAAINRYNTAKSNLKIATYTLTFVRKTGTPVEYTLDYGTTITAGYIPNNTVEQIANDNSYHQGYKWDKDVQNTALTDDMTINELTGDRLAHSFGSATEVDKNQHQQECTICHYVKKEDHTGTWTTETDSTCTTTGTRKRTCTVCGNTYTDTLGVKPHNFTGEFKEKDKGEDGTHYRKCLTCDNYGWNGVVNECEKHSWGKAELKKAATCTEVGQNEYTCSKCSATYIEEIPMVDHEFTGAYKMVASGKDGTHNRKCANCDAYGIDGVKDATEKHSFGAPAVVKTATCISEGEVKFTCSDCKDSYTQSNGKADHKMTKIAAVEAECEKDGNNEYYSCSTCNKYYKDNAGKTETTVEEMTIKAKGHDFTAEKAETKYLVTAATCTESAVYYKSCSVCGKSSKDQTGEATFSNGDANGHSPKEAVKENEKKSDCVNGGSYDIVVYCSVCEKELSRETKTTDPLGHKLNKTDAKPETCEEVGNNEYWTCSVCGKFYSDKDATTETTVEKMTIKAKGHDFTPSADRIHDLTDSKHNWACANGCGKYGTAKGVDKSVACVYEKTASEDATCTDNGYETYKCKDCANGYTTTLVATGHSFTAEKAEAKYLATNATCTAQATYYKSCSACGESSKDTDSEATFSSGAVLGHDFTAETVDDKYLASEPDCTAQATYYKSCTRCGESSKNTAGEATFESGEVLGHNFSVEVENTRVPANCKETGSVTFKCSRCDATEVKTLEIDPDNHKHAVAFEKVDSTCQKEGYEAYTYCDACETYIVERVTIEKKAHTFTNYISNDNGTHTAACDTCDKDFEDPATDTKNCSGGTANCVDKAVCDTCNTAYGSVNSANHKTVVTVEKVDSTCQKEGHEAYERCDACNVDLDEIVTIDKKAHTYGEWISAGDGVQHKKTCTTCVAENGEISVVFENCSGGTANCVDKAVCDTCHTEYGSVDSANHKTVVTVEKVDSTCQKTGHEAYRHCNACNVDLDEIVTIDKKAHTYGEWVSAGDGVKHKKTCTTCVAENGEISVVFENCSGGEANCVDKAVCGTCNTAYGSVDSANHKKTTTTLKNQKAATCTEKGYTGDYCYDCCDAIATKGTDIDMVAHKFTVELKDLRVDATCVSKGEATFKCANCDATDKKELKIDYTNHASDVIVVVGAVEATCTTPGYTGDTYHKCCYKEGGTIQENRYALISKGTEITANGQHVLGEAVPEYMLELDEEGNPKFDKDGNAVVKTETPTYEEMIAARYDDDKWYHAQFCSECHKVVYSPCFTYVHTYNCVETDVCEICDGLCSLIDANKHKSALELIPGVTASCVKDGIRDSYKCSDCGKTYLDKAGTKEFDITANPDALLITKESVAHSIDWESPSEYVEGTCGTSGYNVFKCTVAGCTYTTKVDTGVVSSKHTWETDYTVTKEATCGENGYKAILCSVCDSVKPNSYVIIPATGDHDYEKKSTTPGTSCLDPEKILYVCKNCSSEKTVVSTEGVSGHQFGEWVTTGGDCSTGVIQKRVCSNCNFEEQRTITSGVHELVVKVRVEPTPEKDGYVIYVCKNCKYETEPEVIKYEGESQDEHTVNYDKYKVVSKATCTSPEIREYTCLHCGEKVKYPFGEKAEHEWIKHDAEVATCEKEGHSEYYSCMFCLAEKDRENYPAKGHVDSDNNGKCDECNSAVYGDGTGYCGCICHKENWLMRIIYKILRFFWKLFKIGHSCDCGAVHY